MIYGKFEADIFGPGEIKMDALQPFGFAYDGISYTYSCPLSIHGFSARFTIKDGNLYGQVIEDDLDEEYGAFRGDIGTGFAYRVGEAYKEELVRLADAIYSYNRRLSKQSNRLIAHIKEVYGVDPEYPWHDDNCIFRHKENHKWFALIMSINESKLGRNSTKDIDCVNLKADPYDISSLTGIPGIYLAYHMNKKHWITVVLTEVVKDEVLFHLVERSHHFTAMKTKKTPRQ